LIVTIKNGYTLSADDYANDVSIRELLQEILEKLSSNQELLDFVNDQDKYFQSVTKEIENPLLPGLDKEKAGWWWFRIPQNPGSQMKKDLLNWGLDEK